MRNRGEPQNWGETWGFRRTSTTCSWQESRGQGGHSTWRSSTLNMAHIQNGSLCVCVFSRQEYLNKELYTNKPTKDYFCQFNTTSRWAQSSPSSDGKKGTVLDRLLHVFYFSVIFPVTMVDSWCSYNYCVLAPYVVCQFPSFSHHTHKHQSHCRNGARRTLTHTIAIKSLLTPLFFSLLLSHFWKTCLCEEVPLNKIMGLKKKKGVLILELTIMKTGKTAVAKQSPGSSGHPWLHGKQTASSSQVSICVYIHSSCKANICPKRRQTQMFSSRHSS